MRFSKTGRAVALVALAAASTLFAAGCAAPADLGGSSQGSAGGTTINWLVGGDDNTQRMVKEVVATFQAANSNNLVEARLSTGDMSEVLPTTTARYSRR